MRFVGWLWFVFSLSSVASAQFQASREVVQPYYNQTQIINFKDASGQDVQVITSRFSVPSAEVSQVFEAIQKDSKQSILFSYPEKELDSIIDKNPNAFLRAKKTFFMPFKRAAAHMKNSIKNDRMGLLFVTVNTAYDSFLWVHADSYTVEQRSAIILFNVVLAASFGLDKDLWANIVQPIENRVAKFLDKLSKVHGQWKPVLAAFAANTTMSMAIQTSRVAVLSFPHIIDAFSTTQFWGTSVLMGSIVTLSTFGWSEQLAETDQVKNPRAKYFLRRLAEIRALTMGHLAPSSKLLQPDVYGSAPLVAAAIHGTAGIWMMLNSSKIVKWLESNSTAQRISRATDNFDVWLSMKIEMARQSIHACRKLFDPVQ